MSHTPLTLQHKRGFTLFFAILIVALLLAVSTSISFLASKQLQLLTLGNQSELAFYAADSGMECALYWDKINTAFDVDNPSDASLHCGGGNPITATYTPTTANGEMWSFTVSPDNTACAAVTVTKFDYIDPNTLQPTGVWATDVVSRGYDGPCKGSELERAIETVY